MIPLRDSVPVRSWPVVTWALIGEVYQFMSLFPQPTRTRPAVEYVSMSDRTRQSRESSGD